MNLKRIIVPALFLTVLAVGCGKDATTTTDTESGNWVRRSDLDGPIRTEAVSFVLNDLGYITTGYNGTRSKRSDAKPSCA